MSTSTVRNGNGICQEFADLFLRCLSFAPIQLVIGGSGKPEWRTLKGRNGKIIKFSINHICRAYEQHGDIIGKRFSDMTDYLMVDVDTGSLYHPKQSGLDAILEALENIGLCEPLIVRSSLSMGLHLYFPLDEPQPTGKVAELAYQALTRSGIKIAGGQCELFPHYKSRNQRTEYKGKSRNQRTEYKGHRLPLQHGSYLLDDEFQPISNDQELFVERWKFAASRNLLHCVEVGDDQHLKKPKPVLRKPTKHIAVAKRLPPLPEFTGSGETNEILKELANYGDKYLKLRTIPSLSAWMAETVVTLPGYSQFCSEDSKVDIGKSWCERWAKSHLIKRQLYLEKEAGPDHNAVVAQNALERLKACILDLGDRTFTTMRELWSTLRALGKEKFGSGVGWKTFRKLENIWKHLVTGKGSARLGASPPPNAGKPAHTVINDEGVCTHTHQGVQPAHPPLSDLQCPTPDRVSEASIRENQKHNIRSGAMVRVIQPSHPAHGKVLQAGNVDGFLVWLDGYPQSISIAYVELVDSSTAYCPPPAGLRDKLRAMIASIRGGKQRET